MIALLQMRTLVRVVVNRDFAAVERAEYFGERARHGQNGIGEFLDSRIPRLESILGQVDGRSNGGVVDRAYRSGFMRISRDNLQVSHGRTLSAVSSWR